VSHDKLEVSGKVLTFLSESFKTPLFPLNRFSSDSFSIIFPLFWVSLLTRVYWFLARDTTWWGAAVIEIYRDLLVRIDLSVLLFSFDFHKKLLGMCDPTPQSVSHTRNQRFLKN
jgi:hypothetical protein